jgi:hypothetical protein
MKSHTLNKLVLGGALLSALLVLRVAAQDNQGTTSSAGTATAAVASGADAAKPAAVASKTPVASAAVADIQKLLDAGVSKDIVKAYVEKTLAGYQPSATDLIALKQHGVTDDITTALLQRTAETGTAAAAGNAGTVAVRAAPETAVPAGGAPVYVPNENSGYLDPEGYNYFQYYYLYPRTLASANQQLGYYPQYNYGLNYGFYGPMPFSPYPPSVFARPHPMGGRGGMGPMNRGPFLR